MRDEVAWLVKTERPQVTSVVSWAAKNGDRSENADYQYGKKRLREIDRRIRYLTKRLEAAEVVDPATREETDQVFFGATVTYAIVARGRATPCASSGIDETDPARHYVSWISPVARALIKAREGDSVSLVTPGGDEELEILEVRYEEIPMEPFVPVEEPWCPNARMNARACRAALRVFAVLAAAGGGQRGGAELALGSHLAVQPRLPVRHRARGRADWYPLPRTVEDAFESAPASRRGSRHHRRHGDGEESAAPQSTRRRRATTHVPAGDYARLPQAPCRATGFPRRGRADEALHGGHRCSCSRNGRGWATRRATRSISTSSQGEGREQEAGRAGGRRRADRLMDSLTDREDAPATSTARSRRWKAGSPAS